MSLSKTLKEFKDFALKGNVVDLAVGVMIGGAFNKIVTSLVNDVFMPVIGLVTGGRDLSGAFVALDGNTYETIEAATEAGAGLLKYGSFCQTVIDFILTALCVFVMVKVIAALGKKRKEQEAAEAAKAAAAAEAAKPQPRLCPFCKMEIAADATRCPHCTSEVK